MDNNTMIYYVSFSFLSKEEPLKKDWNSFRFTPAFLQNTSCSLLSKAASLLPDLWRKFMRPPRRGD